MACHILVVGHSLVRRLEQFSVEQNLYNLNLDPSRFRISFLGIGGLTIKNAIWHVNAIEELKPNAVILDLGTNDLDNREEPDAGFVAADIVEFANELLLHTKLVYIVTAYHRARPRRADYEAVLPLFNSTLRRICRILQNVHFWPLRNLTQNWENFLTADGVHLNAEGLPRYYRSIRGAVLHAEKTFSSL